MATVRNKSLTDRFDQAINPNIKGLKGDVIDHVTTKQCSAGKPVASEIP